MTMVLAGGGVPQTAETIINQNLTPKWKGVRRYKLELSSKASQSLI